MPVSIVTSDYQKVDDNIRSLAIVPRAVLDANSAVGFVHYLQRKKKFKTFSRYAIMIFEQISICLGENKISNSININEQTMQPSTMLCKS